jgi:hypothetical protein
MTGDEHTPDHDFGPEPEFDDGGAAPAHPLELALRYGLRYSGLREVETDMRLLLYVPFEICEREMVLPLAVDENVLQVATAYPDPDLEIIEGRFPELEIELVFAPIDRIAELLDELKAVR